MLVGVLGVFGGGIERVTPRRALCLWVAGGVLLDI